MGSHWGAVKLRFNTNKSKLKMASSAAKNVAAEGTVGPGRGWAAIGVLLNYFLIPLNTRPKWLNRQPNMVLLRDYVTL